MTSGTAQKTASCIVCSDTTQDFAVVSHNYAHTASFIGRVGICVIGILLLLLSFLQNILGIHIRRLLRCRRCRIGRVASHRFCQSLLFCESLLLDCRKQLILFETVEDLLHVVLSVFSKFASDFGRINRAHINVGLGGVRSRLLNIYALLFEVSLLVLAHRFELIELDLDAWYFLKLACVNSRLSDDGEQVAQVSLDLNTLDSLDEIVPSLHTGFVLVCESARS